MALSSFLPPTLWPSAVILLMLSFVSSFLLFGGALVLLCLAFIHLSRYFNPLRKLPYPPGPPSRDFILGNARDLLSSTLWFTLTDMAATYGGIMHLRAFNKHIIVLNSLDDAIELMDKRSNNYSDRPYIPMMDLASDNFSTPLKPYGPVWHAHRRIFQQTFKPVASLVFRPTQVHKATDLLCSLLDTPEDFLTHIKTYSVAIIMSTIYGYKVLPKDDPFQELAEQTTTSLLQLAYPGAAIVNVLPFLHFLPVWFPFTNFHRVARRAKERADRLQAVPYKYVQDNLAAGTASPSIVASLLETCKTEEDHHLLKEVAATGYGAGADTARLSCSFLECATSLLTKHPIAHQTISAMVTFILAMAKFPDVQKKAQEELDRVLGPDRLVNYDDEASLPYIQAVFREVLRWRPPVPLGVFHSTTGEDVYKGYYIPEGATIIPNAWAMSRDPLKYKNPEEFNPDRFFNENNALNSDDISYGFGFGRRICPGRHMAAATVWLAIATILSTFDIRAPKDASGRADPLDVEYTGALVSHPHPFKCTFTPRSIKAKQLIADIRNSHI